MIVADVNLIAYLLIDGDRTAESEAVYRRDPVWAAPLLWQSEWRSVLAGYLRRGEIDWQGTLARLDAGKRLLSGGVYALDDERVLGLVASSTCSAYDCEYVALAEALDIPLVTTDKGVLEAFPARACSPVDFTSL